jgi:hypothetical protein
VRIVIPCLAAMLLLGCDFIGGGDTVFQGDDNVVVRDPTRDRLAQLFSRFETVPQVSDEDLERMFGLVRSKAFEGDLDSMLVMLRLAEFQREPEEEGE